MARADFHLHTVASDGTWQPKQLIAAAKQVNLAIIAITDHDTTAGVAEVQAHGRTIGLEVVTGVELSTYTNTEEVHLLGLGFNPNSARLHNIMAEMRGGRDGRAQAMIAKLAHLGLPVSYSRIKELAADAAIGRPHIARALVEAGYVSTVSEAFQLYLAEGRPAYVARVKVDPITAIEAIHEAGGVAVCAHPGLLNNDSIIFPLAAAGLDAIETYHSSHSTEQTAYYLTMAQQLGLLISGGSDCHGPGIRERILLGSMPFTEQAGRQLLAACAKYR